MAYKLIYFDGAGRGEPARLLMAAAGVQFEDVRIKHEDWPAMKAKLGGGQVPILEVGDKRLTQSKAIYRHLARTHRFLGGDEWETAQCDEMVDATEDLFSEYVNFAFIEQDATRKEEGKAKFSTTSLPAFLGKVNKLQMENQGTWLVGKNMTWADIVVAEWVRQLVEVTGNPKLLDPYPQVRKVQEAVFADQNIKAYFRTLKK